MAATRCCRSGESLDFVEPFVLKSTRQVAFERWWESDSEEELADKPGPGELTLPARPSFCCTPLYLY